MNENCGCEAVIYDSGFAYAPEVPETGKLEIIHCEKHGDMAVLAERERCARIVEDFDNFVYDARKVDGYGKGTYAMINGRESAKKIAEEIRKPLEGSK